MRIRPRSGRSQDGEPTRGQGREAPLRTGAQDVRPGLFCDAGLRSRKVPSPKARARDKSAGKPICTSVRKPEGRGTWMCRVNRAEDREAASSQGRFPLGTFLVRTRKVPRPRMWEPAENARPKAAQSNRRQWIADLHNFRAAQYPPHPGLGNRSLRCPTSHKGRGGKVRKTFYTPLCPAITPVITSATTSIPIATYSQSRTRALT